MVIIGSFLCEGWGCWQNWHDSTFALISLEIPGNHTDSLARSQHFVTLWWPAWMRSSISSLMTTGITMRSSYVNRPLLIDKCPRASNNSHIWSGTSPTRVGHYCDVNATHILELNILCTRFFNSLQLVIRGWLQPSLRMLEHLPLYRVPLQTWECFLTEYRPLTSAWQVTCSAGGLNRIRRIRSLWHRSGGLSRSLWLINSTNGSRSAKSLKVESPTR